MKDWDVFISHASEDKETVALPLAGHLRAAGLRVWLDRFELRLGDSLREKIDAGLAKSRFGIVVLSRDFFAKQWPQRELNALFAVEEPGRTSILPVWHQLTKEDVARHSPMLADRVAANTQGGIRDVVQAILEVVLAANDTPSNATPSATHLLLQLLERDASPSEITNFLRWHSDLLTRPYFPEARLIDLSAAAVPTPLALIYRTLSINQVTLTFFGAARAMGVLLDGTSLAADIEQAMVRLSEVVQQADGGAFDETITNAVGPAEILVFEALVFARRREALDQEERTHLQRRREANSNVGLYRWDLARNKAWARSHEVELPAPPEPSIPPEVVHPAIALRTYDALLDGSFNR
jgi:hypothetical protein